MRPGTAVHSAFSGISDTSVVLQHGLLRPGSFRRRAFGSVGVRKRWCRLERQKGRAGGEIFLGGRISAHPKLSVAPTRDKTRTPHTMAPSRAPLRAGNYTVLPLTIPGVPSFPQTATHYLYIRPHAPKLPDENTPRSLFASNLPIDATESSLRTLFAEQLGGARIQRVDIEGARPKKSERGTAASAKAGKKRKRGAETSVGDIGLPQTWDAEILSSGSSAVLVFVDKTSAEMAMKEVTRVAKKRAEITWKSDMSLGLHSECCPIPQSRE